MITERSRIDVTTIKATTDLVAIAQRYTALRKISRSGEQAGPCPLCGGMDRFHVKDDRFYCRQCYPRGGDVIDLVMLVENLPFLDACRALTGRSSVFERQDQQTLASRPRPHEPLNDGTDQRFQTSAHRTIRATHALLMGEQGRAGQAYLQHRGLVQATWHTYKLGYGQTFHPVRRQQQAAIFLPWFTADGKTMTAIQHRFIDPSLAKHERYSFKAGSSPLLFGLHALTPAETLVIVEGEFNCMALHQVGYQAVSVGSESNQATGHRMEILIESLPRYDHILIWFDQPAYGDDFAKRISEAVPIRTRISVIEQTEFDANELLITGELAEILATLR